MCTIISLDGMENSKLTHSISPAITGTAIIYSIPPDKHTRVGLLIAFYCTQFILAEGNLLFSLISRNVAGQTKKTTVLAISFIAWGAGNATAPQVRALERTHSCSPLTHPDFPIFRCAPISKRLHSTLLSLCTL
jgi:hypothetical protein